MYIELLGITKRNYDKGIELSINTKNAKKLFTTGEFLTKLAIVPVTVATALAPLQNFADNLLLSKNASTNLIKPKGIYSCFEGLKYMIDASYKRNLTTIATKEIDSAILGKPASTTGKAETMEAKINALAPEEAITLKSKLIHYSVVGLITPLAETIATNKSNSMRLYEKANPTINIAELPRAQTTSLSKAGFGLRLSSRQLNAACFFILPEEIKKYLLNQHMTETLASSLSMILSGTISGAFTTPLDSLAKLKIYQAQHTTAGLKIPSTREILNRSIKESCLELFKCAPSNTLKTIAAFVIIMNSTTALTHCFSTARRLSLGEETPPTNLPAKTPSTSFWKKINIMPSSDAEITQKLEHLALLS
jgi:hypothetical protein